VRRIESTLVIAGVSMLVASAALQTSPAIPAAEEIIQKSIAATHQNWAVAAQFDRCERDVTGAGTKTYAVTMLLGSPYSRLTAVDDKPLSERERQQEQDSAEVARTARSTEAPGERARRVEKYERQIRRNRLLLEQLPYAFDFTSEGTQTSDGFDAYVIRATPKREYRPTSNEAEVLTGMEGRLWIEQHSFQWIKVEATVVHPVSIESFVASVEPGTRFFLAQRPAAAGVWLPTHFTMRTRARFLFVFRQRTDVDETYFDYRRIDGDGERSGARRDGLGACLPTAVN
jgi:hypothetical protein